MTAPKEVKAIKLQGFPVMYSEDDYLALKADLERLVKSVFDSLNVTSIRNDEVYRMEDLAREIGDKRGIKYE